MNEYHYPLVSEPNAYTYNNPYPTETAVLNMGEASGVASGYLGQTLFNDWNIITAKGKSVSGGTYTTSFECQSYLLGPFCFLDITLTPSDWIVRGHGGSELLFNNLPVPINQFRECREYGEVYPVRIVTYINIEGNLYLQFQPTASSFTGTETWTEGSIHYIFSYLYYPSVHTIYSEVVAINRNADRHLNRHAYMSSTGAYGGFSEPIYDTPAAAMEAGQAALDGSSYPTEPSSQPSNGEKIKYLYKAYIAYDSDSGKWYYQINRDIKLLGKGTLLDVNPSSTIT